jgi:hypothetical protein
MKTTKILYWGATGLMSAFMAFSSFLYLSKSDAIVDGFSKGGLPMYFIPLLGTAKLLGAIGLVIPERGLLKEWVYAGFTFTFIGATWLHISTSTPFVPPLIALAILAVSYWFRLQLNRGKATEPALKAA